MSDPTNPRAPQRGHDAGLGVPRHELSLAERDRRWRRVRAFMGEHELDCLLVGGFRGREQFESYLTDDYAEGVVLFGVAGDPVVLTWTGTRIHRARQSAARGSALWVEDYRLGVSAAAITSVLRELGGMDGRVGVVGLDAINAGEPEGFLPARLWAELLARPPRGGFTDVSWEFSELILPKSEEELRLFEHAAAVAEAAGRRMLEAARPGVGEETLYAEVMRVIFEHGCGSRYPLLNLHSGKDNLAWGPPRWVSRAEPIHKLEPGDLVQAEIFPVSGSFEVQIQMALGLEPVSADAVGCAEVARASYEAGVAAVRPGRTFAEVAAAMEAPIREAGCWALTPLIHTLNPATFVGRARVNEDRRPPLDAQVYPPDRPDFHRLAGTDLVLRPGTTLALEPNACVGRTRVNVGGSVVVTEAGCREVNNLPNRFHPLG